MSVWTIEDRLDGRVVYAYTAEQPSHFDLYPVEQYNHTREAEAPITPVPRRVTKLQFVGRLGDDYIPLLVMSKTNVTIEAFMKMIDWATPEADGTSLDLDDPRLIGALAMFEQEGAIALGRAAEIRA